MIKTGSVYQFNLVRAVVVSAGRGVIRWQEVRHWRGSRGSGQLRSTPRWYFEKYAMLDSILGDEKR